MDILEDKVICQLIQSLKVRLRKKTDFEPGTAFFIGAKADICMRQGVG